MSSHFRRALRSLRTVPKSSLRMNGAYSTTPLTMATSSSKAMKPRNSIPGRPMNRSTCSASIVDMKTPPSKAGSVITFVVRASTAIGL